MMTKEKKGNSKIEELKRFEIKNTKVIVGGGGVSQGAIVENLTG